MYKVMVNSVDKVKKFVNTTTKVDRDVFLKSGRYVIDAKSIMGIFSLDLTRPLELDFGKCSEDEKDKYLSQIKEFLVE